MSKDKINNNAAPVIRKTGKNSSVDFFVTILLGMDGMSVWFLVINLVFFICSESYHNANINQFGLANLLMRLLTYMPTKIAILSIVTSFSGICASELFFASVAKKEESGTDNLQIHERDSDPRMIPVPFSSILCGLVCYFTAPRHIFK